MKKLIASFLLLTALSAQAQVTTVIDRFSTNLTKTDLNFSGDRKIYAIGMNDRNSENYIVVSKNAKGSPNDKLFIEKFTKTASGYSKTFSKEFSHPINLSLSFVNNRMTYSDVDKDGNVEFLYVVEANENGKESPLETVWGVCVYKNKAYLLTATKEDGFLNTKLDPEFAQLPENVKNYFLDFWKSMKKD